MDKLSTEKLKALLVTHFDKEVGKKVSIKSLKRLSKSKGKSGKRV